MAKKNKSITQKHLFQGVKEEELHGFVASNRLQRNRNIRRGFAAVFVMALMIASLAVGYTVEKIGRAHV